MVTNAIKRGWAAAAGAHFGLFSELWSKDPLEDPYQNEDLAQSAGHDAPPAAPPKRATPKASKDTPAQTQSAAKPAEDPFKEQRDNCRAGLKGLLGTHGKQVIERWPVELKQRFDGAISSDHPTLDVLSTAEQFAWCQEWITNFKLIPETTPAAK